MDFKESYLAYVKNLGMQGNLDKVSPQLFASVESVFEKLPAILRECLFHLVFWSCSKDQSFELLSEICALIDKHGVIEATDTLCASCSSTETPLSQWFSQYFMQASSKLTQLQSWMGVSSDYQIAVIKWLGYEFPVEDLLNILNSENPCLRWWAAYHLAQIDLKLPMLANDGDFEAKAIYGLGVRAQVLEVIVRQALAGAPWQEICAGPMRVNRITNREVYEQIIERGGKLSYHLSRRHIQAPKNVPRLAEREYRDMWLKIRDVAEDILPASYLEQTNWRVPPTMQVSKTLVDSIDRTINRSESKVRPEVINKWQEVLCTSVTNKEAAESAFEEWYQSWRHPLPQKIVWCASPVEGMIKAIEYLSQTNLKQLRQLINLEHFWGNDPAVNLPVESFNVRIDRPWIGPWLSGLRTLTDSALPSSVDVRPGAEPTQFQMMRAPIQLIKNELRSKVRAWRRTAELADITETFLKRQSAGGAGNKYGTIRDLSDEQFADLCYFAEQLSFGGQFEAEHLAKLDQISINGCEFRIPELMCELALHCGWWWTFDDCIIVTEKPQQIHFDERLRLHNNSGPALAYSDGWEFFFLEGIRVPPLLVQEPHRLTATMIERESNIEVRRLMLNRFGLEQFMIQSGAVIIHKDAFGVLYLKELTGDEPIAMVKVTNSTAEPDGTYKEYCLRVPPNMTTAKQAVAWTFGMEPDQYTLALES